MTAPVLAAVLAAPVVWAEAYDDETAGADLFPVEAAAVANAVRARRREFTTVRVSARRALARLGLPPVPLAPGENGEQEPREVSGRGFYPGVTEEKVEAILQRHAGEGTPIAEWVEEY